jgi:hypothetical protein
MSHNAVAHSSVSFIPTRVTHTSGGAVHLSLFTGESQFYAVILSEKEK